MRNRRSVQKALSTVALFATVVMACSQNGGPQSLGRAETAIRRGANSAETGIGQLVTIADKQLAECTGIVVAERCVLTSAHCLPDGAKFIFTTDAVPDFKNGSWVAGLTKTVKDFRFARTDIGILFTTNRPRFAWNPRTPTYRAGAAGNYKAVGYGQTGATPEPASRRREGTVRWESNTQGDPGTGGYMNIVPGPTNQIACKGDSGGPTLQSDGNVVGVFSRFFPNTTPPPACNGIIRTHDTLLVNGNDTWVQQQIRNFCVDEEDECGNGICDPGEDCQTCSEDCGVCGSCVDAGIAGPLDAGGGSTCGDCGNGICDVWENCESCPSDCGECDICGDGVCDVTENCVTCAQDCGSCGVCGDGVCEPDIGEDCSTCPDDCGPCGASP